MKLGFTKMQGAGNDYVYVDGAKYSLPYDEKPDVVKKLSDRHFGIGGDGVIFINPSDKADFEMEMWNADGTRGEMCGNGIRCVAKYVYDRGMTDKKTQFSVISYGAVKYLTVFPGEDGKADRVRVNMGAPILEAEKIPVKADTSPVVREPFNIDGKIVDLTCVSMGNPHAVLFVDDVDKLDLEKIGPSFENNERFPKRTNTEFVQVIDPQHVKMRVWERGTGETLACGTGCCATGVAGVLNQLTDDHITVQVLGGELEIEWDRQNNVVWMTGPAREVFSGNITL